MDNQPRICPQCGFPSAFLKRLDHYLSLFFIPLIPVKRGEEFLECNRCGSDFKETGKRKEQSSYPVPLQCQSCGRPMDSSFQFCPYCGQKIL